MILSRGSFDLCCPARSMQALWPGGSRRPKITGKTAVANEKRLATGEISLRELCARRGRDVRDVIQERLEDELFERDLRVKMGLSDGEPTGN